MSAATRYGCTAPAHLLGGRHGARATAEPFESGIIATNESAHVRFPVQFHLVAMFICAWAVAARAAGWAGHIEVMVFIGILMAALWAASPPGCPDSRRFSWCSRSPTPPRQPHRRIPYPARQLPARQLPGTPGSPSPPPIHPTLGATGLVASALAFLIGGDRNRGGERLPRRACRHDHGCLGRHHAAALAGRARDADLIEDYCGLFRARPGLSLAFAGWLLSRAGIPLTIDFIAKFYAVASGVDGDGDHPVPLAPRVAGSILGVYYTLRVIVAMLAAALAVPGAKPPGPPHPGRPLAASRLSHAVLAVLVLLLIGLGTYPAPLLTLIRATAAMVARRLKEACKFFTICGNLAVSCLPCQSGGLR
ncbi:MAG: NADH-quinone oxidoreductase subunit A [Steroidobacteraceae bacterium]